MTRRGWIIRWVAVWIWIPWTIAFLPMGPWGVLSCLALYGAIGSLFMEGRG